MDYKQLSMLDIAYDLLTNRKEQIDFKELYDKICELKEYDEQQADENRSLFYTNITLDGRFITTGENRWDLRARHKFEDVHIDMNDIYADYQDDEDRDADEDDDVEDYIDEDEHDDGTFADTDSFDD